MGIFDLFKKTESRNDTSRDKAYLVILGANRGPTKRFIKNINDAGISNYTFIDVDKDKEAIVKFGICCNPTALLIDNNGNIIQKWYEYNDPGQINFIDAIKNSPYMILPYIDEVGINLNVQDTEKPKVEEDVSTNEDIGMQLWNHFEKTTNRKIVPTGHLLLLQQLLSDALFTFDHPLNTTIYSTFIWNGKLYLEDNSKVAYSIPFLWIRTLAKTNVPKFNETMNILNVEYPTASDDKDVISILQDIKKNGFRGFNPDFDININKPLLSKFYSDCTSLLSFIRFFGDNINLIELMSTQSGKVTIALASNTINEVVNEVVTAFRQSKIEK